MPKSEPQVDLVEIWDGKSSQVEDLATILIKVESPTRSRLSVVRIAREIVLKVWVRLLLGSLLSKRISHLKIRRVRVEENSIDIFVVLGGSAAVVFYFFSHYEEFRKGVVTFTDDVRRVAAHDIGQAVERTYEPIPSVTGERVWLHFFGSALSIAAGAIAFIVTSSLITVLISPLIWSGNRPLAAQVETLSIGAGAAFLAVDAACAVAAGFVAGSVPGAAKTLRGLLTGLASFMSNVWLAASFPTWFFVSPPRWLDGVLMICAATIGASLAAMTPRQKKQ